MAASYDVKGPPGKAMSFAVAVMLTAVLALQPDFGQAGLVIATWALMYFAAGAPVLLLGGVGAGVIGVGWFAYHNSEHVARRIDGFLSSRGRSADPDRLRHQRHPGGRLPRGRHRQRQR